MVQETYRGEKACDKRQHDDYYEDNNQETCKVIGFSFRRQKCDKERSRENSKV
jgi:hypothetical protein